jgi:hypothetical protein
MVVAVQPAETVTALVSGVERPLVQVSRRARMVLAGSECAQRPRRRKPQPPTSGEDL